MLVVEGEKAADAADGAFPEHVVVSPMNGAQSPHRTDWSPLAGLIVTVWPDADEPGREFALKVAKLAKDAGAAEVRIVTVPDGAPEGWDLADPLPDGWTAETIADAMAEAAPFDPDGEEQGTFRVQWRKVGKLMPGIHFRRLSKDPETGEAVASWHWFGSRLDVLGYTRDGENREWGRYLAVYDSDGKTHYIAMPMAAMAGDGTEYRRELLRHGFILAPGKTAREQLEVYLSIWRPKRRAPVRRPDRLARVSVRAARLHIRSRWRDHHPAGQPASEVRPCRQPSGVEAPRSGSRRWEQPTCVRHRRQLRRADAAPDWPGVRRLPLPRRLLDRQNVNPACGSLDLGLPTRELAHHGQRGRGHRSRRL